jgi:hypothetical protein
MAVVSIATNAAAAPIEIEVSAAMTKLPEHAAQIRLAAQTEARARVEGADATSPATIAVAVDFMPGKSIGWYSFEVSATHRGAALAPVRGECRTCKPKELVAKIGEAVATQRAAVLRADAEPVPTAPDAEPAGEEPNPVAAAAPQVRPSEAPPPGGRWTQIGNAGLAMAVVGAAALGTGIGLAVRQDAFAASDSDVQVQRRRDTRPLGIGLAAVGGAALVGGVAMIIVDRGRAKRSTRVAWVPAVGRRELVLTLGGRF